METTLVLRLETPLLINFVDPDWPLRPHEVWRLWRWWAKALVAGALFDRGFLHGAEQQTAVKTPTQEEAECILQIVERKMKLDAHDTCFQIRFEEIDFAPPREAAPSFEIQYGIRRHERRNVRQRDGALWRIDRGSATLVVKERDPCFIDGEAIEAAMGALALAMRLSCFGEGGRRGLGCFYVRAHGRYRTLFEEEPAALIRRAVAAAGAVVDDVAFRCRIYRRQASPCGLPPMPALSTSRYDACVEDAAVLAPYMLFSVKMRREDLYSFFSQQKRKFYDEDFYGEKEALKTWIINGVSRRPPPLMLKIDGGTAYLSVFISADWPRELKLRWQKIQISETDILAATAHVLTDYVKRLGGKAEMVWPRRAV